MTALTHRDHLEPAARALESAARRTLDVPADRAALRRTLGKPPSHPSALSAHRLVAPLLPELPDVEGSRHSPAIRVDVDAIERAFYAVAALIAAQPRDARDEHRWAARAATETIEGDTDEDSAKPPRVSRNLGRCLADWVNASPPRDWQASYQRLDGRLRLVCRQDVEGLHRHLPRLVGYARGQGVDIDWPRLTVDLAQWGSHADTVSKSWLQDYYRTARPPRTGAAGDPTTNATDTDIRSTDPEGDL